MYLFPSLVCIGHTCFRLICTRVKWNLNMQSKRYSKSTVLSVKVYLLLPTLPYFLHSVFVCWKSSVIKISEADWMKDLLVICTDIEFRNADTWYIWYTDNCIYWRGLLSGTALFVCLWNSRCIFWSAFKYNEMKYKRAWGLNVIYIHVHVKKGFAIKLICCNVVSQSLLLV